MGVIDQIETIVVVLMENRSFDHMLGYLSHPNYGNRTTVNGQKAAAEWIQRFENECADKKQEPFRSQRLDLSDDPRHERENFQIQFGTELRPGIEYPMNGFMKNYA